MVLLNCIDFGLYRFTGKRSGSEIFSIMSFGNDFVNTVPRMIIDFWYLVITFFVLAYLLYRFYPRLLFTKTFGGSQSKRFIVSPIGKGFYFILFSALTFVGFRGGIQYKPLNILSASKYGTGKITELVLNTPFTIIKTYGKNKLEEIHWMSQKDAFSINPLTFQPIFGKEFSKKNVVIIILEGIGKEYIGSLNAYKGYTPFLDSLIRVSLVFPNAYANGKRSIEGIPAIVAGMPALMQDPFITSAYSGNAVTSVPLLLRREGYNSVFYHGGTNGTMGFDYFSKLAGYDRYFGRTEYANDGDFDGSWGIYDEPFLQRVASDINSLKEPFLATVFTLSSHHPYKIPDKYASDFSNGSLPIHQSIRYADYALKRFFETVSKLKWFDNTLFVVTADHTAESEYSFYRNHVGLFSIPIIYYCQSDSLLKGKNNMTTQQIDILPTIMDYLGYRYPFYALGKSVFNNSENNFAVSYIDDTYQLIEGEYALFMDTLRKNSMYKFSVDSTLTNNLAGIDTFRERKMESKLKAIVQQFNYSIIHNEMKLFP